MRASSRIVYLDGLDEETTCSMVHEYAEEWGGELTEPVTWLYRGCARIVFAEAASAERFLRDPHYVNDVPLTAFAADEDEPVIRVRERSPHIPLDAVFWPACDAIVMSTNEMWTESAAFRRVEEAIQWQQASARPLFFSLPYDEVWGPMNAVDVTFPYPKGITYDLEEDRLYFVNIETLFYGLQQWYRTAQQVVLHPWLTARLQTMDAVIRKMETQIMTLDVEQQFLSNMRL